MAVIGSLSVKLGLVTIEWDQATNKAKAQAKALQSSLNDLTANVRQLGARFNELGGALGVGVLGFGALIQQTLSFSNEINDLAQGFDLSIGKTLQFSSAVETSGGKAEGAAKMIATLFSKIEDAKSGSEAAIAQFEKIGISFEELNKLKPDEALGRVSEALAKLDSTTQRTKAIGEFFGKAGKGVGMDELSAKLKMATTEEDKHGEAIKRLGEYADNLKKSMENLKIAVADFLAPFTGNGLIGINAFKEILIAITAYTVVGGLIKVGAALYEIGKAMKAIALGEAAISAMQGSKGIAQLAAGAAAFAGAKLALDNAIPESAGSTSENVQASTEAETDQQKADRIKREQDAANANRVELAAAQAKVALAGQLLNLEKASGQIKLLAIDNDKLGIDLTAIEIARRQEIARIQNQLAQNLGKQNLSEAQIANIKKEATTAEAQANEKARAAREIALAQRQKEIKAIQIEIDYNKILWGLDRERLDLDIQKTHMTDYAFKKAEEELALKRKLADLEEQIVKAREQYGAGEMYEKQKQKIEGQMEAEKSLSNTRQQAIDYEEYQRTSFTEGWSNAFRRFAQDAENYGKLGADMFNGFISNMNSTIDNFVQTGKFSFKDFARSIIMDLNAMYLKMVAMQMIMKAMGWLNINLFGQTPGSTNVSPGIVLTPKATGGMVNSEMPYMVGENGPEMFIPQKSGSIVPNMQLAQTLGGNQPSIVYNGPYIENMSAIDTQSGIQFLAKNKQAVWAANQSAQRGLPTSR